MAPNVPIAVAIKEDKKALCQNEHQASITEHILKMRQTKACKLVHIIASIKGIANQIKNRQIKN